MIELPSEMCTDTYIEPPRYAEMIPHTRCIGVTPTGAIASSSTAHSSSVMFLSGKECPRPASFIESVDSSQSSEQRYSERFISEEELYGQSGRADQAERPGDGYEELASARSASVARSVSVSSNARTSSMSDYFGRPIGGALNSSVHSSLLDEISDEWETRSEVARL